MAPTNQTEGVSAEKGMQKRSPPLYDWRLVPK